MFSMKKTFLALLSLLGVVACTPDKSMPDLKNPNDKTLQTVKIDYNVSVNSFRSLDVEGSYKSDPNSTKDRQLAINWDSDTWNDTNNKPKLVVAVGENVYVVPDGNYSYTPKNQGGGEILPLFI